MFLPVQQEDSTILEVILLYLDFSVTFPIVPIVPNDFQTLNMAHFIVTARHARGCQEYVKCKCTEKPTFWGVLEIKKKKKTIGK